MTVLSAPISPASASACSDGSITMISARRVRLQALDPDVTEPAGADHDHARPRAEHRDRLLDRVDRGQTGVGERRDVLRLEPGAELDHRPGRGRAGSSANPPSRLIPGNEPFTQCMSSPRRHARAQPAGDERVHDHRVADLDVRDTGADLVDPAGVLVPGRVGQRDLRLLGPLPLLDVQVGPAQARGADPARSRRAVRVILGSSMLSSLSGVVVCVQPRGLHLKPPLTRSPGRGALAVTSGRCRHWPRGSCARAAPSAASAAPGRPRADRRSAARTPARRDRCRSPAARATRGSAARRCCRGGR